MRNLLLPRLHRFAAAGAALLLCRPVAYSAQASPPANTAAEKAVVLSPFEVTAVSTQRYQASNSISGTAMNMLLKDVPMTINVITSEFIEDAVTGDFARTLDFNTSISQPNRGEVSNRGGLLAIRGFRNRNLLLDGVLASDFLPTYLIDRIEVVKGPNTLYGQSDPGGLVNVISKRPLAQNGGNVTFRYGSWDTRQVDVDANAATLAKGFRFRVLASRMQTDGWRWYDGHRTGFGAALADWQITEATKLRLTLGGNTKRGAPSNRATYPFMQVPTDLNGDGDTRDTVGGVQEATARFNNNFVPWEWTSETAKNHLDQRGTFAQATLTHRVNSNIDLMYLYARTNQITEVSFREFNTFDVNGNNPANNTATRNEDITNAHTLNGSFRFTTGPIRHSLLAGGRFTKDHGYNESFRLRPTAAAERRVLDAMNASGRSIRYLITRADILNGVKIWLDDVPTREEMYAAGFRANNNADSFEEITTYYLSDSASLFNNRLRLLAGIRRIEIVGYSINLQGVRSAKRTSRDTSHQFGINYAINEHLVPFANTATAFEPNGFDNTTGTYFSPETSRAWEFGLKIDRLLGGKVSGSVAYFNIQKKNVVRSDFNPFTFINDVEFSDDEAKGIDFELFVDFTRHWQTTLGYSHVDAKTVKSRTTALGLQVEGAVPHKYSLFTSYQITDGPLKGLRFGGGGFIAKGPIQQFGTSNNRHVLEDGYTEISVFARYSTKLFKRDATFGLNVSNLTDEFYIRSRANTSEPRKIMTSLRMDF